MKTRTRKRADAELGTAASVPKSEITNPESIPTTNEQDKPNRVSFFVTPAGTPDFGRMHARTKSQLSELLRNKEVQKELGLTPEETRKIEEIGFGEDEANALLDVISSIDSVAASRIYKIPREITSQAFAFTPDHRKKINPTLTRVLNKWGPAVIKTWKDEIGLGIVLFSVLNSQVTLMHILENRRKRAESQAPPREKVTQMPAPSAPPAAPEEKPVAKEESVTESIALDA